MDEKDVAKNLLELGWGGLLAMFGGLAKISSDLLKSEEPKFRVGMFFIRLVLAVMAGVLASELIPGEWEYRDAMLFVAGYSGGELFDALETGLKRYLAERIK